MGNVKLMGTTEYAELMNVSYSTAYRSACKNNLPPGVQAIRRGAAKHSRIVFIVDFGKLVANGT